LVCAIASGILGGLLNADPGHLQTVAGIHRMTPSAVPFGMALMIVGLFMGQRPQVWQCVLIPFVVTGGFALSGNMVEAAARHLRAGASAVMFGVELIAGGLAGMTLIGLMLIQARFVTVWRAVRFIVIGSVAAALCVVVVSCLPDFRTHKHAMFWTMCGWQFAMVCYFGHLSRQSH
jgi:hypothetical protein